MERSTSCARGTGPYCGRFELAIRSRPRPHSTPPQATSGALPMTAASTASTSTRAPAFIRSTASRRSILRQPSTTREGIPTPHPHAGTAKLPLIVCTQDALRGQSWGSSVWALPGRPGGTAALVDCGHGQAHLLFSCRGQPDRHGALDPEPPSRNPSRPRLYFWVCLRWSLAGVTK